ncbi:MAG: hypothetical protein R2867_09200 [Caldilineaceae bacterium]
MTISLSPALGPGAAPAMIPALSGCSSDGVACGVAVAGGEGGVGVFVSNGEAATTVGGAGAAGSSGVPSVR